MPDAASALTGVHLVVLHRVLDVTRDVEAAAKILDCEPSRLREFMKAYPELTSYVEKERVAPGIAESKPVAATRVSSPSGKTPEEMAALVGAEEAKMREGLASIGIDDSEIDKLTGARNFGKLHFDSIRQILSGGLLKTWVNIHSAVDKLNARLDGAGRDDVEVETMLREDRSRLIGHIVNLTDRVMQGALVETKINKSRNEGARRPDRPRFQPQAATNVYVNKPESVRVSGTPDDGKLREAKL